MRTRTALIYLTLFLVLAGYFYYFEVAGRRARIEQEEAARHLFQVDKAQITDLRPATGQRQGHTHLPDKKRPLANR